MNRSRTGWNMMICGSRVWVSNCCQSGRRWPSAGLLFSQSCWRRKFCSFQTGLCRLDFSRSHKIHCFEKIHAFLVGFSVATAMTGGSVNQVVRDFWCKVSSPRQETAKVEFRRGHNSIRSSSEHIKFLNGVSADCYELFSRKQQQNVCPAPDNHNGLGCSSKVFRIVTGQQTTRINRIQALLNVAKENWIEWDGRKTPRLFF